MDNKKLTEAFNQWWRKSGVFYDPDTEDVPWFDKRRELAEYAFFAGELLGRANQRVHEVLDTRTHGDPKGEDMAESSDVQVKILCETRPPVTVCSDCVNMRKAYDLTAHGAVPRMHCIIQRVAYINYAPAQFLECDKINVNGNCQYYIDKATVAVEEPKLSFWQRLRKRLF